MPAAWVNRAFATSILGLAQLSLAHRAALRSSAPASAPMSTSAVSTAATPSLISTPTPALISCTRCLLFFAPGVHRGDERPLCDPCLEDARTDEPNRS
eukprot:6899127-Prymnesium_polylepis.1